MNEHPVVVCYDSARAFERFVDRLDLENVRVARLRDSYLRLLCEVRDLYHRYENGRREELPRLLVYVPAERLPVRSDVLLAMAKAGGVFHETLETVARQALQSLYAPSELDSLLANDKLTLEDLDRLGDPETAGRGVIPLIFGTTAAHEIAVRYLADPKMEEVVDGKGALPALARLLGNSFGLPAADVSAHAELKRGLGRHILLNEFLADLREGVEIPALARVARPATPAQAECCRRAAAHLRAFEPAREVYMALARQVEEEFGLRGAGLQVADLGDSDTFPLATEAALSALTDLIAAGRTEDALRLWESRAASFWVQHDERLGIRWQAAGVAVKLVREAVRVEAEARARKLSAEAFVRLYAGSEGDAGNWYRADLLYRHLEARVAGAEDDLALDDLLRAARQTHRQAGERLAERFAAAVAGHGFDFGRVPSQADVFRSEVVPALQTERVAYFLVDALRYEMGVELLDLLREAEEREIRSAVAVPPTVTQIGMAALLPGAERGLAVVEAGGKAAARVGERVIATSAERMALLKAVMGDAVLEMSLDDLLSLRPKTLVGRLEGKRLVVIRSQEIDSIGEQGHVHLARQVMSQLLSSLSRAMRILAGAGVCRFVVAADHGFLLGEELSEAMKVDSPGGHTVELHRRCWIGRGGSAADHFLRLKASDLGLGGDLEFAFPRGLGAFKVAGGNPAYFHGGLSLQELVVPVLNFRLAPAHPVEKGDAFTLRLADDRVTNRVFTATVRYDPGTLLSPPERRVRCVGTVNGREVAFAATAVEGYDPATQEVVLRAGRENHVTLMMPGVEGSGTLVIQLVDALTGAVLKSAELVFQLTI